MEETGTPPFHRIIINLLVAGVSPQLKSETVSDLIFLHAKKMRLLLQFAAASTQQKYALIRLASFVLCIVAATLVTVVDGQSLSISLAMPCSLCPYNGTLIKTNHIPLSWTASMTRPAPEIFVDESFLVNGKVFSPETNNLDCIEWNTFATMELKDFMAECLDLRDYLGGPCCEDPDKVLPPLYKCQAAAEDATILNPAYKKNQAPAFVDAPSSLQIQVQMDVFNAEVHDHGVNGGTISVWGEFTLKWIDERLQFHNVAKEMNCYSFSVAGTSIWTPRLKGIRHAADASGKEEAEEEESQLVDLPESAVVIVLADGRVEDSFWGQATMHCSTLPGASKQCTMSWHDDSGNHNIAYVQRQGKGITNGVLVRDALSMPPLGYKMNDTATMLHMHSDATLGPLVQVVDFVMRFDPLEDDCNICGDDKGAALIPDEIPNQPLQWSEIFPHQQEWTCQQLDRFLTNLTVGNESCTTGRAFFEEACCADDRSSFECESSIHSALANQGNTVTPPDPSPKENHDRAFATAITDTTEAAAREDFVDVGVSIDVSHVMGLNVKSNTMELLVSLELEWYDDRLSWEPFLGGCHRASFRASLDPEQTEIWVPHLELINMADSSNDLPEASASVMYNGRVMWRRTGVLSVTCELTGIENFPFDSAGCFLELGGTRNPLFHRVKYIPRGIQYSPRVKDDSWNFQEYKINTNKTSIYIHTEEISGFSNEIIRYQFYFDRAVGFYVNMFILLYIIFTLMSFGMFFIDYRLGERLGYGSSILFVIVAQDITMSEFTPVTQEFLWIYKLSLGSKIFVMLGIVQSIIALYILNHDDDDDDDKHKDHPLSGADVEEEHPFLESPQESNDNPISPPSLTNYIEEQAEDYEGNETRQSTTTTSAKYNDNEVTKGNDRNSQNGKDSSVNGKKRPQKELRSRGVARNNTSGGILTSTVKIIVGEHLIPSKKESKKQQKIKKLLIVDKITAMCFFSAYGIFLVIMFVIVK